LRLTPALDAIAGDKQRHFVWTDSLLARAPLVDALSSLRAPGSECKN